MGPVTVSVLQNGDFFGPLAKAAEHTLYFSFLVPAGTTDLHYNLRGAQGNPDLFLKKGAYPTFNSFNCVSQGPGTAENCDLLPAIFTPGETWYGVIYGASLYQDVFLNVVANHPACAKQTLTIGLTKNGTLNSVSDCKVPTLRDRLQLVVGSQQTVQFNVSTTNNRALRVWNNQTPSPGIAQYFNAPGGSSLVLFMGPDTYNVDVIDGTGGSGGQSYGITVATVSPNFGSCDTGLAFGGASVTLQLAGTDCAGITAGTKSDRTYVVLGAGQTITVTMSATAFDPHLRLLAGLVTGAGTVLAADDNGGGGTSARIVYTNTGPDNNYTIETSSLVPGATGAYTLTVTLSPTYPLTAPAPTTAIGPP